MSDHHIVRVPLASYNKLAERAKLAGLKPAALIVLAIEQPDAYLTLCRRDTAVQKEVERADAKAARSASPAAQDRAERAAAKEQASERIGTLNSLIGQIGGKVSHREGEDSSVEGEHAKLRATRVYPHCPQWQKLHDQYLSDGQAYEYKEGLRRLRDQLEAEIRQLKKDPTLVLNVAACTQFPMLK